MNLSEYLPLALRTEKPLQGTDRLMHGCMGLITEIGEVVTELKRMAIYGKPLDADRKKHLCEEAGDVMWYIAILLVALRVNADKVTYIPSFTQPEGSEGKWEAMSLMFGEHCGRICFSVQEIALEPKLIESWATVGDIVGSIELILKGLYVLCESCDSTIEAEMENNIAKLRERFPDAFSNEAAEARADKGGLDARNS